MPAEANPPVESRGPRPWRPAQALPTKQVLVVGGGPAGAMAGLTLARAGVDCRLLERDRESSDKPCGDFLSAEAVARLTALDFPWTAAQASPVRKLRLEGRGRSATVPLPFEGRSVRRAFLDRWLLQAAAQAGAQVELGVQVRSVAVAADGAFELATSAGQRFGRALVLANGKHGLGQFHLRRGDGRALLGWKMNFHRLGPGVSEALRETLCLFSFSGGYGGISRVADDVATVALLVQAPVFVQQRDRDPLVLLTTLAGEVPLLDRLLSASEPVWERPKTVANLPYGHCERRGEGGLFPVGDQFAVLPSFTGTGIAFAMASGACAARHIVRMPSPTATGDYVAEAARMARSVLRNGMPLHRLLQHPAFTSVATRSLGVLPYVVGVLAKRTRLAEPAAPSNEAR